ncbi:MAG: histidine phosphatase family protein [Pirellulales bacterium]|nr:histidine phosphatase family protein [Pirellulales bacterium]
MDLYLIRHAQSVNNALPEAERVEDPPLTDLGRRQAACLAEQIPTLDLTRMVVSPFLRTLETAEYLCRATQLAPQVQASLHEVGGCVQGPEPSVMVGRPGMTRLAIEERFPAYVVEDRIDAQGWWRSQPYETPDQAQVRARELLADTQRRFAHTEERVAYVMHADIEMLFLACLTATEIEVPFNTSVTHVVVAPETTRIDDYNDVRHLTADLQTR